MKSYYAIEVGLRYYSFLPATTEIRQDAVHGMVDFDSAEIDVRSWKEPPHERLANLAGCPHTAPSGSTFSFDAKTIEAFVKEYGLVASEAAEDEEGRTFFRVSDIGFAAVQNTLRLAWKGEREAIRKMKKDVSGHLKALPSIKTESIELVTENLWSFICVLFLRDYAAGKTKVCANPDCPNPYFLQQRKGQMYCSHSCAVLINVRRFRDRAASRTRAKSHRNRKAKP